MDGNKLIKSPLNYTGGKYKLLPQLLPIILPRPHTNEINTFVDLFTGGGNVVANINAKKRIANDINGSVIDIFKTFQTKALDDILKEIYSKIEEYNLTIDNQESYNVFRNMYNKSTEKDPIDLFVLICYSFNHQIRFNSKGEYNMPFGKNRSQFNIFPKKSPSFRWGMNWDYFFFCKDTKKVLKTPNVFSIFIIH